MWPTSISFPWCNHHDDGEMNRQKKPEEQPTEKADTQTHCRRKSHVRSIFETCELLVRDTQLQKEQPATRSG